MLDVRPVFFVVGLLLSMLAVSMLLPAAVEVAVRDPDWFSFTLSACITLFFALILILATRSNARALSVRQAFLMTTLAWIILPAFAALPLMLGDLRLSYTDAFFEAMSGFTTTGSTVITGLDHAPPGLLLWRSLLQWFGGIGIVVVALSVLPMLRIGGMQLFRMEFGDQIEKVLPRAAQIGLAIGGIYLALTFLCALAYWIAGMSAFDAVNHAMTTVSTGGFSTRDASLGFYSNSAIHLIAIVFMIIGALPFLLYFQALQSGGRRLFNDSQVHWFLSILAGAFLLVNVGLAVSSAESAQANSLGQSLFSVTAIMTGTGFTIADYNAWGSFSQSLFLLLMFIGGCAGSTTGGIKIFRVQVLCASVGAQLRRLLQPHGVFNPYYKGKRVPGMIIEAVMGFFFLFVAAYAVLALALSLMGLDFVTALSGAAAAIFNVGPGLGPIIGPAGTFAPLPDQAKWLLSAAMLLGRLEVFTVLVLFTGGFWRA